MKFVICIMSIYAVLHATNAGLLPHINHHHDDIGHFVDADFHNDDLHHSTGIHLGHSSAVIIDGAEHHLDAHPVYHHDAGIVHDVHHDVHIADHHSAAAAQIVHHEPIHQVEPVHHVTKVVHHEPHHFLHYTNPIVDHHVVHQNSHIDEHHHAADLHHSDLHHGALHHSNGYAANVHHSSAAIVHNHHSVPSIHHHGHAALVRKVYPSHHHHLTHSHISLESPSDILAFAKHQLHGKYGKVKITETHY